MADGSDVQRVTQILMEQESSLAWSVDDRSHPQRLLLLELFNRSRSFAYICHLVRYWSEWRLGGHLDVVVTPQFLQHHPELLTVVKRQATANIQITAIAPEMAAPLVINDRLQRQNSSPQKVLQSFRAWRVLCHYARQLQATQCLVMDLDGIALPLALSVQAPCPISGLCFHPLRDRPTHQGFRYGTIRSWQHKALLRQILKQTHLKQLFCVDPLVMQLPIHLDPQGKAVPLPDPVQAEFGDAQQENLRQQWAVEPGRRVFLHVSDPQPTDEVSGVCAILEAIAHLPAALCRQICLVLVGECNAEAQSQLAYQIAALRRQRPVQIIARFHSVGMHQLPNPLHPADVILISPPQSGNSNGLLTSAAALQKPILTTDEGLIGGVVKRCQLGITVGAGDPKHFAAGLAYLVETPLELVGDRQQMQQFAARNTDVHFAETVFRYLCS